MVYQNEGERLRSLRIARKMTQKQVAEELNISESTWCQYENVKRHPDGDMLKQIGNYFCVSVDYLLGITEEKYGRISIDIQQLVNDYNLLTKDKRERLHQFIREIKEE